MALAEYWANHYMAGMLLLHTLLGGETAVVPNSTPSPDGLVLLLNEVARGEYHPEKYFTAGTGRGGSVLPGPPSLREDQVYKVIRLNAETRRNRMVSVEAGGLIFEEPVWAILAAESLSPRHSAAKFALPRASDVTTLWKKIPEIAAAVRSGAYLPQDFFAPVEGYLGPKVEFEVLEISGKDLAALRLKGVRSFGIPPRYFELFTR